MLVRTEAFRRAAAASYTANPVNFDITNDYLTRGAGLTGAADGGNITLSIWLRRTGAAGTVMNIFQTTSNIIWLRFNSVNQLLFSGSTSTPTVIFQVTLDTFTDNDWHHVMVSSNGTTGHAYFDQVSQTPSTLTTGDFDLTLGNWAVGAATNGASKFGGDLADVWFDDSYIDLSDAGNRAKFITAGGAPVNLGADGSTPTGASPLIFFSGATDDWHTNKGTGGGYTENGALTDGTGPVQL